MKYTMTRNEAKRFLQEQTNRWYKGEITTDEYRAIDIDYVPLDLSTYPAITKETEKWINILFDEESTDRKGNYMLRGFAQNPRMEREKLNLVVGAYDHGCSWWAYNDQEMLIYTYCEGDTTLQMFSTREAYEMEKAETLRWYKEEY